MTAHKFKITDGCPDTGHKIACNTTQAAPAFGAGTKSAAERAEEGAKHYAAYRQQNKKWLETLEEREAEKHRPKAYRQMLRPDQLK